MVTVWMTKHTLYCVKNLATRHQLCIGISVVSHFHAMALFTSQIKMLFSYSGEAGLEPPLN